jgi:hypothetical protein
MSRKRIICLCVVLSVVAYGVAGSISGKSSKHTAQTLIEVLPYAEKDPLTIETPAIDKDIQYGFRLSIATLMRQQSILQELVRRDEVRRTQWFKSKDEDVVQAIKDLQKNLGIRAQKEGNYIEVSMTCDNAEEAALIVNEMAQSFVASQGAVRRMQIRDRLAKLEERRTRVEAEVTAARNALDEVRKASGFTDLEERSYQHPVTVRLIRLEQERDNCSLEAVGLQAHIENLKQQAGHPPNEQINNQLQANLEEARASLIVLHTRLEHLQKMCDDAKVRKKDLDLVRVQYERRQAIRDERLWMLDTIKCQIEKLRIMADDPETGKVRLVGDAPTPL